MGVPVYSLVVAKCKHVQIMPGIDKIIRGMLKYHATMKEDMLKQLKMVKDNPQVSTQTRLL